MHTGILGTNPSDPREVGKRLDYFFLLGFQLDFDIAKTMVSFKTYRYIRGRSLYMKTNIDFSISHSQVLNVRILTPEETAQEHIREEPLTGDTATITNTSILLRMECIEKSASDQVGGPDHGGGLDEEATGDTTNRETDQLGGHNKHPLI